MVPARLFAPRGNSTDVARSRRCRPPNAARSPARPRRFRRKQKTPNRERVLQHARARLPHVRPLHEAPDRPIRPAQPPERPLRLRRCPPRRRRGSGSTFEGRCRMAPQFMGRNHAIFTSPRRSPRLKVQGKRPPLRAQERALRLTLGVATTGNPPPAQNLHQAGEAERAATSRRPSRRGVVTTTCLGRLDADLCLFDDSPKSQLLNRYEP